MRLATREVVVVYIPYGALYGNLLGERWFAITTLVCCSVLGLGQPDIEEERE